MGTWGDGSPQVPPEGAEAFRGRFVTREGGSEGVALRVTSCVEGAKEEATIYEPWANDACMARPDGRHGWPARMEGVS